MSDIMPGSQIEVNSSPFVDALLNDCVENFYMLMPVNVLPATDFKTNTTALVDSDEVLIYRIQLPDDFVRLISFRCAEWNRSITQVVYENSTEHNKQYHSYTFGGNSRPVATLVSDSTMGRSLEYYNYNLTTTTAAITDASCAVKGDVEDIPHNLIDVFAWYVASIAFQAMDELPQSEMAMKRVAEFITLHQ